MTGKDRIEREAGARRFVTAVALELCIVAFAAFVYVAVRDLTQGSPERAIRNAHRLLAFERSLGIDHERTLVGLALEHPILRTAANWIYIWGHWPIIITAAAWLYVHRRERYAWLRNAVFASGMIAFAFFAFVPMAPPRLAGLGYVDTITRWSSSYRVLQPPDHANLYAAMPSLHFGWDLLVGIALFMSTTLIAVRVFAVVMPTLMGIAVVMTANHWVLDVIVGLAVVSAGVAVAETSRAWFAGRERARVRALERARANAGETVREST